MTATGVRGSERSRDHMAAQTHQKEGGQNYHNRYSVLNESASPDPQNSWEWLIEHFVLRGKVNRQAIKVLIYRCSHTMQI